MRRLGLVLIIAMLVPAPAFAAPMGYTQTNLVSDGTVSANVTDSALKNPWGIAFGSTTPFFMSDNGSGMATAYDGSGSKQSFSVTIPPAPGSLPGTKGTPTGAVFNPAFSSPPPNFGGDILVFATEDGDIAAWQPASGSTAVVRVDNSASGTVYKGLAIVGDKIYATDFANNKVDVFTDNGFGGYSQLGGGSFLDPNLPAGFAPFGIQNIGGHLYVTFAKKQASGNDDVPGAASGFVDEFDANGNLVRRVIGVAGDPSNPLNSPWGIALAPGNFGELSGLLLVGNAGNGRINAFNPVTGAFVSTLNDTGGTPIVNERLWSLAFGNTGTGFDPNKLYFTAGLTNEAGGLFGSFTAEGPPAAVVPAPAGGLLIAVGFAALWLARRHTG